MKHEVKVIPKEEILANRSNAYEFIDIDKQETLEEAIVRIREIQKFKSDFVFCPQSFQLGAKWQQARSYSDSEVKLIINDIVEKHCTYFEQKHKDTVKLEWFEQFKKK